MIIPAIRGGKSLQERAIEDMKKMGVDIQTEPKKEVPKPIPRSETEEELILAVRSAETSISTMEHRLSAFRERSEADTTAILDAVSSVSAEVAELKTQVHTLWDQIAALEEDPSCLPEQILLETLNLPRIFFSDSNRTGMPGRQKT